GEPNRSWCYVMWLYWLRKAIQERRDGRSVWIRGAVDCTVDNWAGVLTIPVNRSVIDNAPGISRNFPGFDEVGVDEVTRVLTGMPWFRRLGSGSTRRSRRQEDKA